MSSLVSRLSSLVISSEIVSRCSLIVNRRNLYVPSLWIYSHATRPYLLSTRFGPSSFCHYSRLVQARLKNEKRKKDLNKSVMVIDNDGNNKGIMSMNLAIQLAESEGMELIEIVKGDKEKEGIYRMMTRKEIYEKSKKEREINKKNPTNVIKDIKISTTISDNDLATKLESVRKLFMKKHTVKIWILPRLKRYQMEVDELKLSEQKKQQQLLHAINERLNDVGVMITKENWTGKNLVAIFKSTCTD